ncbi:long-chain-alcohol O-fatty-acyltransferase 5 [Populus alba x Populus x berolinensis]|uniref:Long-chain-alcohol O-fatty-acyltransferase 5 n=2 Tax=Populus alba x Populus x berolinensis TaxID=444605 RepID=A0AAD6MN44_9ROSI|nr:long-chain-alcohol O-fatty-acyltransferase 5 [Populus alba x Populus x berolinensis]
MCWEFLKPFIRLLHVTGTPALCCQPPRHKLQAIGNGKTHKQARMEGEIKNLIKASLSVLASLIYCHFISSKIPKGKLRLVSLLPIFYLFITLPLYFSYLFPNAIASLFISWLANFKLALFAFDHGPLSCDQSNSLLQFIPKALLPIKIKQNEKYPSSQTPQNSPKLALNLATKVLLLTVLVGVNDYKGRFHQKLVLALYCCMVYLLVDIIFGVFNATVHAILHMELEPPSNEPYLSTSLQDFWGRRWNLMVTNLLRHTVYKPVRSSLGSLLGQWAPLPAVAACFLVSGLMHELLFYRVTRASPSWEVTLFFVLQGVCLVVELAMKRWFGGRWQLHWAVSGPLTVGFVMMTAMWLFFPPLIRSGADEHAIEECKMFFHFVKEEGLKWIGKLI